jgi:hypothetical protein
MTSPMGHVRSAHMVVYNIADNAGNPCPSSKYLLCAGISPSSSGPQFGICISTSGNCSSGLIGDWSWSSVLTTTKGKSASKKLSEVWSPNPGNPSDQYVTEKKKIKASKKGKVKFVDTFTACNVSDPSSCLSAAAGLIPE